MLFFYHLLKSLRPRQWLKNLSVAAALVFTGNLFETSHIYTTLQAIFIFCIISSSIYLLNDILDRDSDRQHPFKRLRPIAAGKITVNQALVVSFLLAAMALWAARQLSIFFFTAVLFYWTLQLAYSLKLKHLPIIDLIIIAGGFILRVYAGALAINAHLSIWFLLCIVSVALLISVGKRRAELTILTREKASDHRQVLSKYPEKVLDGYVSMFANSAFLSWALFTFFQPPLVIAHTFPSLFTKLPLTLAGTNKWLMITIPIVIYGIMRYMKLIYEGSKAESPERLILNDQPLLTAVTIWGLLVIIILYGLPSTM